MKIVAFNCSPKAEKANTALILNPFIEGMEKAGARVELFFTEFAGALLRPAGDAFRGLLELGRPVQHIPEAAREAGRQLVDEGDMSPETLAVIGRELMPLDRFMRNSNKVCRQILDQSG